MECCRVDNSWNDLNYNLKILKIPKVEEFVNGDLDIQIVDNTSRVKDDDITLGIVDENIEKKRISNEKIIIISKKNEFIYNFLRYLAVFAHILFTSVLVINLCNSPQLVILILLLIVSIIFSWIMNHSYEVINECFHSLKEKIYCYENRIEMRTKKQ